MAANTTPNSNSAGESQPSEAIKWAPHDLKRPRPPRAEPKSESELANSAKAPANAIVLFDGTDVSAWNPTLWKIENGYIEVTRTGFTIKDPTSDYLTTKESFGSMQLHLEWWNPNPPQGVTQSRANSGVIFMKRHEIQILDNTNNPTYADGLAGALYGKNPPLFDASRPSGNWNYYDITFRRPICDNKGQVIKPGSISVLFNGILVQDNFEINSRPPAGKMPLQLQNHHGQLVRFRNIWVIPLAD